MSPLLPVYYQIKQSIKNWIINKSGSTILFVEKIIYMKGQKPVELVQSSYRRDLYKYIVRFKNYKMKNNCLWIHKTD